MRPGNIPFKPRFKSNSTDFEQKSSFRISVAKKDCFFSKKIALQKPLIEQNPNLQNIKEVKIKENPEKSLFEVSAQLHLPPNPECEVKSVCQVFNGLQRSDEEVAESSFIGFGVEEH